MVTQLDSPRSMLLFRSALPNLASYRHTNSERVQLMALDVDHPQCLRSMLFLSLP